MKKYTQEEVDKILEIYQILMDESKNSVLDNNFEIRFQAKTTLLRWLKQAEKRPDNDKLKSDINAVMQMISLMDAVEGENNQLRLDAYYTRKENEQLRFYQIENNNLKESVRELSDELEKVMKMKSEEYFEWLTNK